MQPYFVPYLGYFQLLGAVDKFVVLDDVNYINRGWINRNQIAMNGQPMWLTLPLSAASQNKVIREIEISPDDGWKRKMKRSLTAAYARAPEAARILPIFSDWLSRAEGNLSAFLYFTLYELKNLLELKAEIIPSSTVFPKNGLKGQDRILDICQQLGAKTYCNPSGGREIYDPHRFREAGVEFFFVEADFTSVQLQGGLPECSNLSILDLLMHNERQTLAQAAGTFELTLS